MKQAKDYGPGDRIYTFVDKETGENTHVDSEALRVWCSENKSDLDVVLTPVTEEIANRHLVDKAVDVGHVFEILDGRKLDPIIYGMTGTFTNGYPDVLLIDGHHRYVGAALCKLTMIPSYVLRPELWHPFIIKGLPDVTAEHLRSVPARPGGKK